MKKEELIFDENYVGTLTVQRVSKYYGDSAEIKALDEVSLQLFTGQFVVILGASGSGKNVCKIQKRSCWIYFSIL